MRLENLDLEHLIDCLPENRPLYKDSGLWQIRTDDMENVYMDQHSNESLLGFLIRYLEWCIEKDEWEKENILFKLSCYGCLV